MQRLVVLAWLAAVCCADYTVTFPNRIIEWRTGDIANFTLSISSNDTVNAGVKVFVQCENTDNCFVENGEQEVSLSEGDNATLKFSVKAIFLGITKLVVTVNGEEIAIASPSMRILRSNRDHILNNIFTACIAVFVTGVTFMMGTQLEWGRIKGVFAKPIGPIVGFLCQFGLMPIIAFLLAEFVLPSEQPYQSMKLALFAAGTCPGGGKSSFWTIIFGGNLDLSVSMTFTQTIAALFMMPIWITTLGTRFYSDHVQIPFMHIVRGLVVLIIPTSAGMFFIAKKPHLAEIIRTWIKRVTWVATFVITAFAVYVFRYIIFLVNWQVVVCGCALPWSGYIVAYIVATLFRQKWAERITIAIETGLQNIGIAMILVMWCMSELEADLAIVVLFVTILATDKPLIVIYLVRLARHKCGGAGKKDSVADKNAIPKSSDVEIGEIKKAADPNANTK